MSAQRPNAILEWLAFPWHMQGLLGKGVGPTSNQPLAIKSTRWAKLLRTNVICQRQAKKANFGPTNDRYLGSQKRLATIPFTLFQDKIWSQMIFVCDVQYITWFRVCHIIHTTIEVYLLL